MFGRVTISGWAFAHILVVFVFVAKNRAVDHRCDATRDVQRAMKD